MAETLGSLCDKLSIVRLKIYHTNDNQKSISLSQQQENLVNGLFACKDPNVSPFHKPTFITMRVEDIDKKFAL